VEHAAREIEDLLADRHRGGMTGAAGDDGAATRERARAPVELARVASHDAHVFDAHPERVGGNLREHREVTLALRADAGGDANLPAGPDRDARALIWPDAGALDVAANPNADVPALGPQPRLILAEERLVADDLRRLIQRRPVVAAVIHERRRVL